MEPVGNLTQDQGSQPFYKAMVKLGEAVILVRSPKWGI
jgi:hypothetical protein